MAISKIVEQIREGNLENLECLYKHYFELFSDYLEKNKDVDNIEEKYQTIIKERIKSYINNNRMSHLADHIRYMLDIADEYNNWNYDEISNMKKSTPVKNLVYKAQNDSDARDELIKKYMYIVERELSCLNIDIEYEDALQMGYLLLIRAVNNFFMNYELNKKFNFSTYIISSIHASYPRMIRNANFEQMNYMDNKEFFNYSDLVDDIVIERLLREHVDDTIENCGLSNREKDLIKLRYGFDEGGVRTLIDIADKYGVTKERIRQIEYVSLGKIAKHLNKEIVSEYSNSSNKVLKK